MHRLTAASLLLAGVVAAPPSAAAQLTTGDALLVTVPWLAQHQHDRNLVILQVGPPGGFAVSHIAGSQPLSIREISTPFDSTKLSLEMPADATLRSALESKGISDQSRIVVVFDSEWVTPTTRAIFTLGYAGLSQNTVMLDGGLAAWQKAGHPVTSEITTPVPGHLSRRTLPATIVDHDYVASLRTNPHVKLIDARAAANYSGPASHNELAGHIPGAVNLPWGTLFDENDQLLNRSALTEKFRAIGVQPGDTIVGYCHVGAYATAMLFAARVLGHPVRLYDGSFQDWSRRKLPTEVQ